MTAATVRRPRQAHLRQAPPAGAPDSARNGSCLPVHTGQHYLAPDLRTPNITDGIEDLLELLEERQRLGMIIWLAVWYYDGWRPGYGEVTDLVAVELGKLTVDDCYERQRLRQRGQPVDEIPLRYLAELSKRRCPTTTSKPRPAATRSPATHGGTQR